MGLTQPAATKMLAELESALGQRLFDRVGRAVLNPAGERVLGYFRGIRGSVEALNRDRRTAARQRGAAGDRQHHGGVAGAAHRGAGAVEGALPAAGDRHRGGYERPVDAAAARRRARSGDRAPRRDRLRFPRGGRRGARDHRGPRPSARGRGPWRSTRCSITRGSCSRPAARRARSSSASSTRGTSRCRAGWSKRVDPDHDEPRRPFDDARRDSADGGAAQRGARPSRSSTTRSNRNCRRTAASCGATGR